MLKCKFSAHLDIFLKEEFIEMTFDLQAKNIGTYLKELDFTGWTKKLYQNISNFVQFLDSFY